MIYLIVIILLFFLSFRYDIQGKTKNFVFWYRFVLVVFILIGGVRWRLGLDTPNYLRSFYYDYPTLGQFSFVEYGLGKDPFYVLINSIVKTLGGRFFIVQLIQASIVNVLIFKYIKKHCSYFFSCIFLYFVTFYYDFNMEIMRGSISIVICLFAYDYILDKKWLKGYLLLCIALMFHLQTIVMFVLPIFFFLRLNRIGIAMIFGAFIFAFLVNTIFGEYLTLLNAVSEDGAGKAEQYLNSEKYGDQTHNLKFMAATHLPYIIYSIVSLLYLKKYDNNNPLLKLEPFLLLGVVFLVVQLNLQIAYRYVDYFRIHFILFFSEFFYSLFKRDCPLSRGVVFARTVIVFIPLFFMIGFTDYRRRVRYLPYSSVIERKIDKNREQRFMETQDRIPANRNVY